MQQFDIDVSGEDLLTKDYTICIADKNGFLIKGFKFDEALVRILSARYGQGLYKYQKSKKGKALFRVRLYSIVIYYLFKSLKIAGDISLNICRDFVGRDAEISDNLKFFLEKLLGLKIEGRFHFGKLDRDSNAHRYAYLMRKDNKDKLKTYAKIGLDEIEAFLIK